ncbi:MAG: PLP-dependent lyase/thiolase [Spirochaetia bacterium]|nr:PLP-dependent lyase/thiolase [Spirochaetia bacterium]
MSRPTDSGQTKYQRLMQRKGEIIRKAVGIDYQQFESGSVAFDYEEMMRSVGYSLDEIRSIQAETGVGGTPLLELKNVTALARRYAGPGKGARVFLKDEAANPSGSFKARRAAVSVYHAQRLGFKGVIAATSGNYGAAVASQAAMRGLDCIVVQECYDSRGVGQPEIVEKGRKCEAYGAEVLQLSVGPELFYVFLQLLEETGYFNASLYTPFGIAGIETLGAELSEQMRERTGADPDAVVVTNAGGGNLTGTARGMHKSGVELGGGPEGSGLIAASVNLEGLNMAGDRQFNRKSFTTGHTGFGIPFAVFPDRSDVPRSAGRPLRYMDRYVTVQQGEVFYMTEALARLEGLERGPAGNIALAAAFALAQEMDRDQTLVVQETEYTGAGKHVQPQLDFARQNGIEISLGDPRGEIAGESIVLPEDPGLITARELDLEQLSRSYVKRSQQLMKEQGKTARNDSADIRFLAAETRRSEAWVRAALKELE